MDCVFDCLLDSRSKSCIDDLDPLAVKDCFRKRDADEPPDDSPFRAKAALDPEPDNKLANIAPPGFLAAGAPHVAFLLPDSPSVSTAVKSYCDPRNTEFDKCCAKALLDVRLFIAIADSGAPC